MALVLLAMMLIVKLGPDATGKTLLSKKMHCVAEVFVTSPALMNLPIFPPFTRTLGNRCSSGKALEVLGLAAEALAVIANFGEQARSDLGSGTRQGTKQIMIGMTSEELFNSLAIESQLLFDCAVVAP